MSPADGKSQRFQRAKHVGMANGGVTVSGIASMAPPYPPPCNGIQLW
jgi:hypothetical protein